MIINGLFENNKRKLTAMQHRVLSKDDVLAVYEKSERERQRQRKTERAVSVRVVSLESKTLV